MSYHLATAPLNRLETAERLSGLSPRNMKAIHPGDNLILMASMKKHAPVRTTGSFGRSVDAGKRSVINSAGTSDSASLIDSGDGWSGRLWDCLAQLPVPADMTG